MFFALRVGHREVGRISAGNHSASGLRYHMAFTRHRPGLPRGHGPGMAAEIDVLSRALDK